MDEKRYSTPVSMKDTVIGDSFIGRYQELVRNVMLPYQWEVLNDRVPGVEKSSAIRNFRIAAGLEKGDFYGEVFQDTDLAKWLEGASYSLVTHPDVELEEKIDEIIDIIELAQEKDGYLNTFFSIRGIEKKWSNLYECHELYTAGHMIEAAVAYYFVTGKDKLLKIMSRCADHIVDTFGKEPGKLHGCPGHQEVELALVRLYDATGNDKYLQMSKYFLDVRGEKPNYFIDEWKTSRNKCTFKTDTPADIPNLYYNQSHEKVREQENAVGHSVRAMYMYSAMSDIARLTEDESMFNACKVLWADVVRKQMYITGAVGSTHVGEAFTFDYDLPNETAYAETCASIGLAFFAHRMQRLDPRGEYADIIEKIIYNVLPASISADGKSFLYVNPLEVWPEASQRNPDRAHVKPVRQPWYGCACCPPNVVRFISSFSEYIYSVSDTTVFVHQYIASRSSFSTLTGTFDIEQTGNYPWDDKISVRINNHSSAIQKTALRIPGWCKKYEVCCNGKRISAVPCNGYLFIDIQPGICSFSLKFDLTPFFVYANPRVRNVNGKAAIQRGPVVYCLEEKDNGKDLNMFRLETSTLPECRENRLLPEGICELVCSGYKIRNKTEEWLYSDIPCEEEKTEIIATPYFYWGNREYGEMQVWTRY